MTKRLAALTVVLMFICPLTVHAVRERNPDGGGGSMGQGTSQNKWTPSMEGVRVTITLVEARAPVIQPTDFTNKRSTSIQLHPGKANKLSYNRGIASGVGSKTYTFTNLGQSFPRTANSQGLGEANIEAVKNYFTGEQVTRSIANLTGIDSKVLTNGKYRLLLESTAYAVFQGISIAMTVTEAALYDQVGNGVVHAMPLTAGFRNLLLSMFLETAGLGYSIQNGPESGVRSSQEVIAFLGLGIVHFSEITTPPAIDASGYEYRVNTEVITAVMVRGGQSGPDHPVSVIPWVTGKAVRVDHVYYPEGDSQIVWIRWTIPSTPQTMTIYVTVPGGERPTKI